MWNSDAHLIPGSNEKVKDAKPFLQNPARRKLADISNLQNIPLDQNLKPQNYANSTDEYIEKLRKENESLVKLLAQRNKMIEQRGRELEQLTVNFIKLREQNQQLALLHTHTQAELNSGKDRLKVLQHEVLCKAALLASRKPESEENAAVSLMQQEDAELLDREPPKETGDEKSDVGRKRGRPHGLHCPASLPSTGTAFNRVAVRRHSATFKATESKLAEVNAPENRPTSDREEANPVCKKTRGRPSKSLSSAESSNSKKDAGNKRPLPRRQSLRLKGIKAETIEESVDGDDLELSKCCSSTDQQVTMEPASTSQNAATNIENKTAGSGASGFSRPSRVAATKVQSYKERPINIKLRRPE